MYLNKYKDKISKYLGVPSTNVFLFWKGRVALYSILKAIGIQEDDEIILPAFTCVVVPNAIIYLNARPIYVDIDPKTYNIDINNIERKINSRTKAIVAQNTFGLSSDLDPLAELAKKHGLMVIEDCAHGFGGEYKGRINGTIADFSFFSTQWNKPFSTGIGGFAVGNNPELNEKLGMLEKSAIQPSLKEKLSIRSLMFLKDNLFTENNYWFLLNVYRYLSDHNLILGSSQGYELEKSVMPLNFLKGLSVAQAKKGMRELNIFDDNLRHRKRISQYYKDILTEFGIDLPFEPEYSHHTFLKFPLLVKDRQLFFKEAKKHKVEIGDWFLSPIHPVIDRFENWYYQWNQNPIAETISRHIVTLPTHRGIEGVSIENICDFLKSNLSNIIRSTDQLLDGI